MTKPDYTLIFIVEDDAAYATAMSHALEKKNFMNVRIFKSGEECLEHIKMKPDVVLLDYMLGEGNKDGMDVLKALKKHNEDIQVVFLTAVDELEIATQTMKLGAYDYVVKSEVAFERIRNLLRRIKFENHIKGENRMLRRSRRIIVYIILFIILGAAVLGSFYLWR